MPLLPDDDGLDLLHTRDYEVKVYRLSDEELLARGVVSDRKPPGLYILDDPEPLEVHQMHLELRVAMPSLEISRARVLFETHPHTECPLIAADYEKLMGLSIARGFTRKTRDLFGGPNGCTHTNALLQAMAPAVVQATWSLRIREQLEAERPRTELSPEERELRIRANLDTCHVWAGDGRRVTGYREADPEVLGDTLLPIQERLEKLAARTAAGSRRMGRRSHHGQARLRTRSGSIGPRS
jgi:hypothetical protein